MNIRWSRFATGLLAAAVVVLSADTSRAVFYKLEGSPDEWGLVYDVELTAADRDTVNVEFTLSDPGRLGPIYSATVVAFSLQTDSSGGRGYDVKEKFDLQPTDDGKYAATVQIPKEHAGRAMVRILTLTVDGKRQTAGAAYIDIPLSTFLNKVPAAASSQAPTTIASPPKPSVKK